jgi:septum formation protein
MRVILASSSPRRKEILKSLIASFDIIIPEADESALPGENPREHAERVSELKARGTEKKISHGDGESLIIASDTIVTIDGKIIGKPFDFDDAVRILENLGGRTHYVISAITILLPGEVGRAFTASEKSAVTFKNLNSRSIRDYLERIEYLDKAGAYAAQEHGDMIIKKIEGSRTNVIGFPLRLFFVLLAGHGLMDSIPFEL